MKQHIAEDDFSRLEAYQQAAELRVRLEESGEYIKQLEKELHSLKKQLLQSQKLEVVGQLTSGIAHDFNNLLTVIGGYSELLLDNVDPDDSIYSKIKQINKGAQRAASITHKILSFSARRPAEARVVDINEILADLDGLLRRIIGEDIDYRTRAGRKTLKIKVDPGLLEQVLLNLIINARDAIIQKNSAFGANRITVETGHVFFDSKIAERYPGCQPGPHVMIAVSDTGIGMNRDMLARIFDPFFTTKNSGSGLGLSIVKRILIDNQAALSVYSEPGCGTTFKIYWPQTDEVSDSTKQKAELQEFAGREKLVLVEDDVYVKEFAARALGELGYEVCAFGSGEAFLKRINAMRPRPRIIISDARLPNIDGHDLAGYIHSHFPDIKVLLTSGYDSVIRRFKESSDTLQFLPKPYTVSDLAGKIRQMIG